MSKTGITEEFTSFDQRAVIKVCGVGGGGGNAVGRMIEAGLKDVDFIAINTDAQALKGNPAGIRIQIGSQITGGLGSGAVPAVGQKAALEDRERLQELFDGADMVFLTAGLGGGTGTGASPIIAEAARASGALTVAIVTLPFEFEGNERMMNALEGLGNLEPHVDTLIVIPNDRVAALSQNNVSFLNAFRQADEVLHNGVRAISELITVRGVINLDFADVRTIMQTRGRALMGIGTADGENRAKRAAEEAIICPLLEQSNINGAMGVLVNIKGGSDIGMREVQDAVTTVQKAAHPDANIIFGAVVDDEERPELQVTVIAAGFPQPATSYTDNIVEIRKRREEAAACQAESHATSELIMKKAAVNAPPQPVAAQAPAPEAPQVAAKPAPSVKEEADEFPFLFPEESAPAAAEDSGAAPIKPEDDLAIPAFMRKRMRR